MMSEQTAPTQTEIAALTGSDLADAVREAGIDSKSGGSRSNGHMTADEQRAALVAHYCETTSQENAMHPDDDETTYAGTPNDRDTEPAEGSDAATRDEESSSAADTRAGDDGADATSAPDSVPTGENPDAPNPPREEPDIDEQREQQLEAGKASGALARAAEQMADATAAEQRAGHLGAKPSEARVDNMTRRSDADALQGHFVRIDFNDEEFGQDAIDAVERVIGEGNAGVGSGDYGVYTDPGVTDENGYPVTATVMLRDEHSALVSSVPYGALRPAQAGQR
jgi:hypothetical protein